MDLLSTCVRHAKFSPRIRYFLRPCGGMQISNLNSEEFLARTAIHHRSLATQTPLVISSPLTSPRLGLLHRESCVFTKSSLQSPLRQYSFAGAPKDERKKPTELTEKRYHEIADETLEALTVSFEELVDTGKCHGEFDVMCASGVLTLKLTPTCTYVINKQTPNRQLWLSSPSSGPKRYDFVGKTWVYLHDNSSLHDLLSTEISQKIGVPVTFSYCSYGPQKLPAHYQECEVLFFYRSENKTEIQAAQQVVEQWTKQEKCQLNNHSVRMSAKKRARIGNDDEQKSSSKSNAAQVTSSKTLFTASS